MEILKPVEKVECEATINTKDGGPRQMHAWTVRPCLKDAGIVVHDPHGYWLNLSSAGARKLATHLLDWARYQGEQFKPTGFYLLSATGERKEIASGEAAVLIGDSFYIRNANGEQLTEAFPYTEWSLTPIYPAASAKAAV